MGQLVDGVWTKGSISSNDESGSFKRLDSVFRHNISEDNDKYIPETNRYHLYVSYACPWAHRTLIFRKLKKLENHISVDYIHPDMLDMGWSFATNFPETTGDTIHNKKYAHEIYKISDNFVDFPPKIDVNTSQNPSRNVRSAGAINLHRVSARGASFRPIFNDLCEAS